MKWRLLERKPSEAVARFDELNAERERLELPWLHLPSAKQLESPGLHLPAVNWKIPAKWFMGWSPLDGFRFHSLKARSGGKYLAGWRRPNWRELVWSVVFLLIVAAVYTFSIYSETWGSFNDALTALTAGAGGAITFKIALPIFKSQRLRSTSKT